MNDQPTSSSHWQPMTDDPYASAKDHRGVPVTADGTPEPESCAICAGIDPDTLTKTDDLPLCTAHWNRWLATFISPLSPEPPCSAHLIGANA